MIIKVKCCRIFSFIFILFLPFFVEARDTEIEKDLQQILTHSKKIITRAETKLQNSKTIYSEINALKSNLDNVRALHMLLNARFNTRENEVRGMGSKPLGRHVGMYSAYLEALEKYIALVENLPDENDQSGALSLYQIISEIKILLDKILYKKNRPIYGTLPYRHLNYPAKEPATALSVTPAYLGGDSVVSDADLDETSEAPLTELIAEQAETLNWDPVTIYEWVKNNIKTEWYWGCMKGAEEALRQKSGNDCDQSALLVSLLRASGYPSRYVRGVIEFFPDIEQAKNLTGLEDPEDIAGFFRKAGIPSSPVIEGGRISNIQIEHIWVESEIPFANFHGAVIDDYGKEWIGLDTSIKVTGYEYNDPPDIMQEFDLSGIKDEFLSDLRPETPLEYLNAAIEDFINQSGSIYQLSDFYGTKTLIPEVLDLLPASLQFREAAVTHEYTAIPDELIHKVRFLVTDSSNSEFLDIEMRTLELSNQQITVGYEPETVEDQEIIDSYGGLDNTPAYLVRLRPVIRLNGENADVSTEGLPIGSDFNLAIELASPNGVEKITNTHVTGNYTVIGIVAQKATSGQLAAVTEGKTAQELLHEEALRYIDRWNQAEEELASLLHLSIARPLPTVVTLGGVIDVTYLLDTPHDFQWKGLYVDADFRTIETAGANNNMHLPLDRQKIFMQLSALQGSVLEHKVLEDDFAVDSISTAKVIQLAAAIIKIDEENVDTVLPSLPFEENIREYIANAVNQGLVVTIPGSEITHQNWTGTGYINENPQTGEAGYMLSGEIAGSMTAGGWPENLLEIFSAANSKPPNKDPASAKYIYKITDADLQTGTVGERLAKSLQVYVADGKGSPVKGTDVRFTVKAGGGRLDDFLGQVVTVRTVQTDARGIASVQLTLGERTGDNPTHMWKKTTDIFPQQTGENVVDAKLVKGSQASLSRPFVAFGWPKEPKRIKQLHGDGSHGYTLSFAGFVSVGVEDEYGNPVANHTVNFKMLPLHEWTDCISVFQPSREAYLINEDDQCLGKGIPALWDECKDRNPSFNSITDVDGAASMHVMLGGLPGANYPVEASALIYTGSVAGTAKVTFDLFTIDYLSNNVSVKCEEMHDPFYLPLLQVIYPTNSLGQNIDAGEAGKNLPVIARLSILKEGEVDTADNKACAGKICNRVTGTMEFAFDKNYDYQKATVTFDGKVATPDQGGTGLYSFKHLLKIGINSIAVKATAKVEQRKTEIICSNNPVCTIKKEEVLMDKIQGTTITIYGVKLEDVQFRNTETGDPVSEVLVNISGLTEKDYDITYKVNPAEYEPLSAYMVIFKKQGSEYVPIQYINSTRIVGEPCPGLLADCKHKVTLLRGYYFDLNSSYRVQGILNSGSTFRGQSLVIKSSQIDIPLQISATANLEIYKPPVIESDSKKGLIPDADEFTKGAATFVNLDNDDRDGTFDFDGQTAHDSSVSKAGLIDHDDELVRIKLKLKPNDLKRGVVKIRALSGGDSIKIWKKKDKSTASEYKPGDSFAVPGIAQDSFTVEGKYLVKELWVEGIKAHSVEKETVLEMSYELSGNTVSSDKVALTVLGIQKIEWVGKSNSRNNDAVLDDDPNWPTGLLPKGVRVFPDARMTGVIIEPKPRNEVDVKVTLTAKPPHPVGLYLRSFDIDDPSSDKGPVDDPGDGINANINEASDDDNRGATSTIPAYGKFSDPVLEKGAKYISFDAGEREKKINFTVTMQPGDNFRVCGNADRDFLKDMSNADLLLDKGGTQLIKNENKQRIVSFTISSTSFSDQEVRKPDNYCSNTLTVWRFLHIERDSMGVVKGNNISGNVTGFDSVASLSVNTIYVDKWLRDGSKDLDSATKLNGRFESGKLTMGSNNFAGLMGNGRRYIELRSAANMIGVPLAFSARDNDIFGNATISGTVTMIVKSGGLYTLQLNIASHSETPIDWPEFIGGTISVASGPGVAISGVDGTLNQVKVGSLAIPFTLEDDDRITGDIIDPDTTGIASKYAKAYIVPLFDTGKDSGDNPFKVNLENPAFVKYMRDNKGVPKSVDRCWIISIINGFQSESKIDNDPAREGTDRAFAYLPVHGVVMSTESMRDWIATPSPLGGNGVDPAGGGRQGRYQEIMNHEIGHLYGLDHEHGQRTASETQGGVMNPSCCPPDNPAQGTRGSSNFTNKSLNLIRKRGHPGN